MLWEVILTSSKTFWKNHRIVLDMCSMASLVSLGLGIQLFALSHSSWSANSEQSPKALTCPSQLAFVLRVRSKRDNMVNIARIANAVPCQGLALRVLSKCSCLSHCLCLCQCQEFLTNVWMFVLEFRWLLMTYLYDGRSNCPESKIHLNAGLTPESLGLFGLGINCASCSSPEICSLSKWWKCNSGETLWAIPSNWATATMCQLQYMH